VELDPELIDVLIRAMPTGEIDMEDNRRVRERAELLASIADDDLETAMIASEIGLHAEFRGIDGHIEAWRDWAKPFEAYTMEIEEVVPAPGGLLILTRQSLRPRATSVAIEGEAAAVLFFDGRTLKRVEFHLDRDSARRAAGLA
jgi:hypothetical protein